MDTHVPEEHTLSRNKDTSSHVLYVEELANAQDAWISITDAARITRTSEAMARRWVSSGRLAVKRQPVGINQHTRLVRLSDVAAIRPIIDPTAAISDEVHTLDLPSIPRQQAQILQNHERLLQQVQEANTHVKALFTHIHTQSQVIEHVKHTQIEHERKIQDDLECHRVLLTDQLQRAEATLQFTMQEKEDVLVQLHQRWQQRMEEVHQDLVSAQQQQQKEHVHTALVSLGDTIRNQQQELERFQQSLTEQYQDVVRYQEDVAQSVERQFHEMTTTIGQYIAEQRQQSIQRSEDEAKREHHLKRVIMEVREAHTMLRDAQRHFTLQDQQIQHLTRKLQDETQVRKKAALDLLVLQKHLQVLQREIESVKRRKGEA